SRSWRDEVRGNQPALEREKVSSNLERAPACPGIDLLLARPSAAVRGWDAQRSELRLITARRLAVYAASADAVRPPRRNAQSSAGFGAGWGGGWRYGGPPPFGTKGWGRPVLMVRKRGPGAVGLCRHGWC